jgi:phosphoribosylaminoimidazole-succinocarboxamide synthase
MDRQLLRAQIPHVLKESALPALGEPRRGKVRDVYSLPARDALLFVTSDRISAFDRVLGTVPFKGELLTGLAAAWFARTAHVCRHHVLDRPDPAALVVRALRGVPVEVVVRGFLTGSLWRDYVAGRDPYGLALPPGLNEGAAFPTPVITPTTKEAIGTHDEPLSEREVVARGLVSAARWTEITEKAQGLFAAGQQWARSRGLELVDTKYEFGVDAQDGLWVMDEIHTPDSSRFWQRTADGVRALDKEFLRQWLIARGWQGDGPAPEIPDETWVDLAARYVELYALLEGAEPALVPGPSAQRLAKNLRKSGILP